MANHLLNVCDKLWRRIVILRAGGRCEICGRSKNSDGFPLWLQACHIISRRYWATRWHPKNGICGCPDCHDHKTIMAWLVRTDRQRYKWIMAEKIRYVSHRDIDLKKILQKLEEAA